MTLPSPSRRQSADVPGRHPLGSSALLIAATLLGPYLTGCGGEASSISGPGEPSADGSVAKVHVTPPDAALSVDASLEFSATVLDSAGSELDRTVEWSTTDPGVARVSDDGRARGRTMGRTGIIAGVDGVRDTALLRIGEMISSDGGSVTDPDSAITLEIPEGAASEDMIVSVEKAASGDGNGDGVISGTDHHIFPDSTQFSEPVSLTIRYDPGRISSDEEEDRITVYRLDSGIREEITTSSVDTANDLVTARIDHFSRYAAGFPMEGLSVTVSPDSVTLGPDESTQLEAIVRDADGDEVDRTVAWSSSDASVATIDEDGTVTAQSEGEATLTASSGDASDSAVVTVTPRSRRVTLEWSAPSEDQDGGALDDLAGYRVYYSTSTPVDETSATVVEVGDTTRVTVEGLDPDIYHFAVSAVDTAGNESPLSAEVTADAR